MISWLKGTWEQNDLKQGKKGWETWQVMDAHQMAGTGITMEGRDTVEMEKITILLKNDTAYYIANVKENPEPVFFRFTRLTKDSFVCENPDHDFPKKVVYRKDGNALIATISGNDDSISYSYRRKP